jgi:undecaprenyl-diphosphatase
MRRTEREAIALGLLQGPVELLPVSSSGHLEAVPWLLGWDVAGWDGARRKELAVGLHAGSAAVLLVAALPAGRPRAAVLAAAVAPAGLAGLWLEGPIEARLGTPGTLAAGLLAGGLALVAADCVPGTRPTGDAGVADGLWLGLAQACALFPGVSRNGATLAAARARGFGRGEASRLSWAVGLPVLGGATLLKAVRSRSGRRREPVAGAIAACLSTAVCVRLIGLERRRPLWRWAVWRAVLAGAILAVRHNRAR